jgi:hypothetical protein
MGIKTDNVKSGTGGLPKSFGPGNQIAKINNISIRVPKFVLQGEPVQYEIVLDLETEPLGEAFEGWLIDKDNPSEGSFLGQTGRIKSKKWPYKDGTWKNPATGKVVTFDYTDDILKFIQQLEDACGTDFLKRTSGKFQTLEDLVDNFNTEKSFEGIFLRWCVAADVEMKADGHPEYHMYLPDYVKGFKVVTSLEDKNGIAVYNATRDLYKKGAPKSVAKFSASPQVKTAGQVAEDDNDAPNWEEGAEEAFETIDETEEDLFPIEEEEVKEEPVAKKKEAAPVTKKAVEVKVETVQEEEEENLFEMGDDEELAF